MLEWSYTQRTFLFFLLLPFLFSFSFYCLSAISLNPFPSHLLFFFLLRASDLGFSIFIYPQIRFCAYTLPIHPLYPPSYLSYLIPFTLFHPDLTYFFFSLPPLRYAHILEHKYASTNNAYFLDSLIPSPRSYLESGVVYLLFFVWIFFFLSFFPSFFFFLLMLLFLFICMNCIYNTIQVYYIILYYTVLCYTIDDTMWCYTMYMSDIFDIMCVCLICIVLYFNVWYLIFDVWSLVLFIYVGLRRDWTDWD